jgi:hypothetical protein
MFSISFHYSRYFSSIFSLSYFYNAKFKYRMSITTDSLISK